jgi:hypothetical protein
MVVTVESLTGFDVYRDGGSLSASFLDSDGLERTLFFPIDLVMRPDRQFEWLGYKSPVLQHFYRHDHVSRITGETIKGWDVQEQPVTWEDAVRILDQIRPLAPSLKTDYPEVFAIMVEVARAEGQRTGG